MKRLSLLAAGLAVLLSIAACSSSGGGTHSSAPSGGGQSTSAAAPAAGSATITIKNFGYSGDLTVKAGASVTVVNDDSVAHTLTDKASHKFDTGSIGGGGGKGTFTAPSKPGKYSFGCTFHPDMAGTLTVTS